MSKQSLAAAIQQMEAHLTEKLVSFSSKKIREMSEEIKEELTLEYDAFFPTIVDAVIGSLTTPGILAPYTNWRPLSQKWRDYKVKYGDFKNGNEHYLGLSNGSTRGGSLGRGIQTDRFGRRRGLPRAKSAGRTAGRNKIGSFQSYIQSLNTAGTTERFFGPISITYDFVSPSTNIKVSLEQNNGVATITRARSAKRGTFVAFPKTLKMTATITAFGKLKGVKFDEWSIVDYIIKRVDLKNEKQWVKINSEVGIGRSRRPIRAVITPMLRYYMDKRFSKIVQDAVKARS